MQTLIRTWTIKKRINAVEVPWKCCGRAIEVPFKCRLSAVEVQTATATYLPLQTPPLSTVGWSKTVRFNNLGK